ncbi:MAG: hypothetical protein KF752_12585 [Pirellulaceae bacterium]|nr:hypothetical protein [Pirellulaceae bacterium]
MSTKALNNHRWRCGRIISQDGSLQCVQIRWWPYRGNCLQAMLDRRWRPGWGDRCELYFHQPHGTGKFLSLSYLRSSARTSLSTVYVALLGLDEQARIRGADAIVCHVTNDRISDRLMRRWGWQPHCSGWPGRHYIKRFYGVYPAIPAYWRGRLSTDND